MRTLRSNSFIRLVGLTAVSTLVLMPAAMAQVSDATGIADPSRAGEQIMQPELTPNVSPDVEVRQAPVPGAPAGADKVTFVLEDIQLDGVSTYNKDALKVVYADKVGKTISLADVYGVANDITLKYRNDGYILTQVVVPPQTIDGGTVRLQVVEGYVANVRISKQNDMPVNVANIEGYAKRINTGGPLNVRDLERQLLIINDLPGVTARSILSPSPNTPGAADLDIVLDYDPVDGLVSLDNFGSRYLGDIQVGAATTLNSMLGQNEAISAQIAMAPQSWYELAYGTIGYEQPVGPFGTKVHFNASATDTEPGYDLKQFEVKGRSYLLNFGATHPFIRSRSENLTGRVNLDWRRVKSSNNIEDTRRDRITALRFGGRYEFIDMLVGPAANMFDMELSKGLKILGANEEDDPNMTRSEADPQATKLEAEIQRLQRVTSSVNVLLAARGQLASHALLSSEEFAVGGVGLFGRGFDPSEITGDEGIAGKVELQWKDPVKLETSAIDSYQLYGFYDIGKVWNMDATTSSQKSDSLASVGAGVRVDLPYDLDGGFAVAFPLTREPQTAGDYDPKFYFNLSKRF